MKKTLLLSALSFACLSQANVNAQEIKVANDVTIWANSSNGRWACSSTEGAAYFWDTQTTVPMVYNDQYYYIDGINNEGWAAGSIGDPGMEQPVLVSSEGEVKMLPIPEGSNMVTGSARNLTADGQLACGFLQPKVNAFDNVISAYPYIWEISGNEITAVALPFPEKDYTGRAPQGYYPLFISADKDRVIGRQIDFSGYGGLPIVWDKGSDGQWSYKLLGEDVVYLDGPDFPEWPEEPEDLDVSKYMTEEELNAYQTAYDEWIAGGYVGEMPAYEDFINDAEKKAQYLADKQAYDEAMNEYNTAVNAFQEVFFQRLSGTSFDLYSMAASDNGRYVGFSVAEASDDPWSTPTNPAIIDLENNDKYTVIQAGGNACIGSRITDNGDVVYRIPYAGTQYDPVDARIIMNGSSTSMTIPEYLAYCTDGKVNDQTFKDAGLAYTYTDYSTGEPVEVTDKILTGTVNVSANGLAFVGFGSDPNTFAIKSWAIDATEFAGVNNVKADSKRIVRSNLIADGKVQFLSEVVSATLYGLDGSMRMSINNPGSEMNLPNEKGMFILRTVTADGEQHADKIVLQ